MSQDATFGSYNNYCGGRGYTRPARAPRTAEQVAHRYRVMCGLQDRIEKYKTNIKKYENMINSQKDEMLKEQEILDNLSRGENIPGESY